MSAALQMRLFAGLIGVLTFAGLVYVFAFPPESLRTTADGTPHFAPKILNPETGRGIPVDELVRHYKGG